ncbi:MAG: hypothetical protein KC418_00950 [Anaerolineales bacterium]|nr:hypothetical protein [Anaerolineales bacterium]MCB8954776.1 hypothetical protein [Ardenticatenales bacterium]
MTHSRDEVLTYVLTLLEQLAEDWDYEGEVTPETLLFRGLNLQSLDVVVLGNSIVEHYNHPIPYADFLAEIGQREFNDVSVAEWVDFTYQHISGTA